jgi:hypothetical protein
MRTLHIAICGLLDSTIFSTLSKKGKIFEKVTDSKMCVLVSSNFCLNEMWSKMYTGLDVNYPLFLSDFIETWNFWTDFRKLP